MPHAYVGATASELAGQGASAADVYTYGAASAALSQGQAAQAWNELQKQQNYPSIKQVASHATCPEGFLISPDGTTCVNIEDVHIRLVDSIYCGQEAHAHNEPGWATCSVLVRYLDLNENKAMKSGSLPQVTDAAMRGLRALRMTTGSFGWTNVRSQLRALAWVISTRSGPIADEWGAGWAPGDDQNVDELQEVLEKSIAPYYDKDVQNQAEGKARSDAVINALIQSQHGLVGSVLGATGGGESKLWSAAKIALTLAVGGAIGLYVLERPLFNSLLRRGTSTVKSLPLVSKVL